MIKLGQLVIDCITGFRGVVTSRTEYLFGCVRYGVEALELKDGKPTDPQFFDEQRLAPSPLMACEEANLLQILPRTQNTDSPDQSILVAEESFTPAGGGDKGELTLEEPNVS